MTFYQTKRFDAVPIDTIEVEDDDEVPSQHYGKVSKDKVELPMFYNSQLQPNEENALNLDQILQKDRDTHFLERVDKQNKQ